MTQTDEESSSKLDVDDVDRDFDAGFYEELNERFAFHTCSQGLCISLDVLQS